MSKPKILAFIPYYLPGFKSGGPVRTLSNMIEYMGDEYEFYIVTLDRDLNESKPYENIIVEGWNNVGKAKVYYLPPKKLGFNFIRKMLCGLDYDAIFLNSFFDKKFTLPVLFIKWLRLSPSKPIIISPRGEFSDGAIENKPFIKKSYISFTRIFGLLRGLVWQASATPEYKDIRSKISVDSENLILAQDFPTPFKESGSSNKRTEFLQSNVNIIFLSRVAPMKNLLFAIDVLSRVKVPFIFDIYGMVDDADYWEQCQDSIKAKGLEDVITYKGEVGHEDIFNTLSAYDLFLLPSLGEGYGHAIIEAMTAGVPVLISDKTPWRDLQSAQVGWDISLDDIDGFVSALNDFSQYDDLQRAKQREIVKAYALELASSTVLAKNRDLFERALAKSTR
jgi:glycosyltransferase involved in cell wall biosynthesis